MADGTQHHFRFRWTADAVATLRHLYPDHAAQDVAVAIGCSTSAAHNKAAALGLSKSRAWWAREAERAKIVGAASRFRPGQTPWNKGTHFVAGGRSAETRFKAGRPAHEAANYLPIGSTRITKDGYLERKVTDDPALVPARRWVAVHRQVWEAAHGTVPPGHAVVFKPGHRTTAEAEITLDRIELVTRAELMRRNSYHTNYPPELRTLVQLRGALNRKINNRRKRLEPTR
jgi:hypothetical protein